MKANELMLGDWVYGLYPDGSRYADPFRISAVDIYPLNRSPRIVTIGGYGFHEEHLEPIPLTPEILEKNGFKEVLFDENGKESDNGYPSEIYRYDTAKSGYIIELGIYSPNCIHIQWKEFGIDGWETGELASFVKKDGSNYMVHELQHALRLCGIDKEITL